MSLIQKCGERESYGNMVTFSAFVRETDKPVRRRQLYSGHSHQVGMTGKVYEKVLYKITFYFTFPSFYSSLLFPSSFSSLLFPLHYASFQLSELRTLLSVTAVRNLSTNSRNENKKVGECFPTKVG